MKESLMPCAFCGAIEEHGNTHDHLIVDGRHALQCWSCHGVGAFAFEESRAGEKWNMRNSNWEFPKFVADTLGTNDMACVLALIREAREFSKTAKSEKLRLALVPFESARTT